MKPDVASLPPVLILASGFILLLAIAALAANPGVFRPDDPPVSPGADVEACPDPASPTPPGASVAPTAGPACDAPSGSLA